MVSVTCPEKVQSQLRDPGSCGFQEPALMFATDSRPGPSDAMGHSIVSLHFCSFLTSVDTTGYKVLSCTCSEPKEVFWDRKDIL